MLCVLNRMTLLPIEWHNTPLIGYSCVGFSEGAAVGHWEHTAKPRKRKSLHSSCVWPRLSTLTDLYIT